MGLQSKKQWANGMHDCPNCDSILVQPVDWHWRRDGLWNVKLRCPECAWWCRGNYSQTAVERYDEELNRGSQALIEDLRALVRANMREEIDRFAAGLAADRILPEDFHAGRRPA